MFHHQCVQLIFSSYLAFCRGQEEEERGKGNCVFQGQLCVNLEGGGQVVVERAWWVWPEVAFVVEIDVEAC